MNDFITLECPTCGSPLQITDDVERFACSYCKQTHIVKRSGGLIKIERVIESIKKVQDGVDKTASELAIVRLKKEIKDLESEIGTILNNDGCLVGMFYGTGIFLGVIVIILAGGYAFLKGLFSGDLTLLFFGAIIAIPMIILFVAVDRLAKAERRGNEEKAKPLKVKLEAKKAELSTHQKIVSGEK